MIKKIGLLIATAIFLLLKPSQAQTIDEKFRPQITSNPRITASAIQSDGKIIVAGNLVAVGANAVSRLARINVDGTLDKTFTPPLQIDDDYYIYSLALQPDGKIMVGAKLESGKHAFRLNANGTLDPTFSLASTIEGVLRILPLPNGQHLIFSFTFKKSIVRINADGSEDASFQIGTGPDGYGVNSAYLALQSDGKYLVAGSFTSFSGQASNGIVRINPNGLVDASFTKTELKGGGMYISSIAVQPDDKIIVSGSFNSFNGTPCKNIIRLFPNGSVDPSFIVPGPTSNVFDFSIGEVKLLNNAILVGGFRYENNGYQYVLIKLNQDGSLDNTFSIPTMPVPNNTGSIDNPIISTQGNRILFTATFNKVGSSLRTGIAVFDQNGALDKNLNPALKGRAVINSTFVQADGKILIGGEFDHVGEIVANNLVRLNEDGSVDNNFLAAIGDGPSRSVNSIKIDNDGKILVGGGFETFNNKNKSLFVRLNSDGSVDESLKNIIYPRFVGPGVNDIEILPNGKILVGGCFNYVNNVQTNCLVRLNTDGTTDNSFNQFLDEDQIVFEIERQSNGNLLIGGDRAFSNTKRGGFLFMTNPDGAIVNSFPNLKLSNRAIRTIAIRTDDSFLVAGNFAVYFNDTDPNPIYQMTKEGNLIDSISVAVYSGEVSDIEFVGEHVLLAGSFRKVNSVTTKGSAKVKINGVVSTSYNFNMRGYVREFTKADVTSDVFYYVGSFTSIMNETFYNAAKINLSTPNISQDLQLQINNIEGKITLKWTDNSDNESGFSIYRSDDGASFKAIDTVGVNSVTFVDVNALPMKDYSYRIVAFNEKGKSSFSNTVTASTNLWIPPVAPKGLTYAPFASSFEKVNLSWQDVSDNETGFELERSVGNSQYQLISTIAANNFSYTEDFSLGLQLRYRIRAFNHFGKSEYSSILEMPVVTGTELNALNGVVKVYPNPARNFIMIESDFDGKMLAVLFSTDGKKILDQTINGKEMSMDITSIPQGLYILRLTTEEGVRNFKLVKND